LIDQAVGILRRRLGVSAGEALGQLKEMSDSQEIPLVAAASSVLKDAVRRRQADDSTPSVPDGRG
jgi:AmiR/NasT family two-component response regulator